MLQQFVVPDCQAVKRCGRWMLLQGSSCPHMSCLKLFFYNVFVLIHDLLYILVRSLWFDKGDVEPCRIISLSFHLKPQNWLTGNFQTR